MEIQKTIIKQLGGIGKLSAMVGASNFIYHPNEDAPAVSFMFKMNRKMNTMLIEYNKGLDLYNVSFIKATIKQFKVISTFEEVYFDDLIPLFEKETGLYLTI